MSTFRVKASSPSHFYAHESIADIRENQVMY